MLLLLQILLGVYILSINVYSVMLIRTQHLQNNNIKLGVGKLIVTGMLGGALGIYISMFIFKYKLQNLILMVIMPMLIAINVYIIISIYSSSFGFAFEMPYMISTALSWLSNSIGQL